MKKTILKINGREIPLRFRMPEFMQIEEEIGNLGEIRELIYEGKKRIRNVIAMVRIMGNAGLKEKGEKADITDEWLTEHMKPFELMKYQSALIECINAESESEALKQKNEEEERDLVLEEIEGKKDPVNSHTGE
jgi:hypothetical protein